MRELDEIEKFAAEIRKALRMGSPTFIGDQYPKIAWLGRALLFGAALLSLLIGAWLVAVILFVLPHRNAGRISFWTLVCAGFLSYGALTILFLAGPSRSSWLGWSLVGVSLGCIPAGLYAVGDQLRRAAAGGDFEGYLLLMGAALAAHGTLFSLHALLTRRDSGHAPR